MNWLPSSWFNKALASEPLNWLIVGVVATIVLMFFHVVMQAFGAMQGTSKQQTSPGAVAQPQAPIGTGSGAYGLGSRDPSEIFVDDFEAKYVGDGWLGNS